jgi:hypothetical protein
MTYIHYGADKFIPEKFTPVKNAAWGSTKPESGGLWASAVDSEFGWKDWCESENFHLKNLEKSFMFKLKDDARILRIRSVDDLELLPKYNSILKSLSYIPDFEKAAEMYDGIELDLSHEVNKGEWIEGEWIEGLYFKLYGWDCDSILILNPDVIVTI